MALTHSPQILLNNLVLFYEANNPRSGVHFKNLISNNNDLSLGTSISSSSDGSPLFKKIFFGGTNQYLFNNTPVLPSGTQDSTIICWCRPDSTATPSTYTGLVSYGGRSNTNSRLLSLNTNGGSTIYVSSAYWSNDYVPNNLLVTPDAWNMVGMVTRGSALANNTTLFCGNATGLSFSTGNSTTSAVQATTSTNLAIGCTDYPGRYFKGEMFAVLIYDRELTQIEIASHFAALRGRVGI